MYMRYVAASCEEFARRLKAKQDESAADKFYQAADQFYRRAAAEDPKEALFLARFLARRGQFDEALEIAENGWQTTNADNWAYNCAAIMKLPDLTPEQILYYAAETVAAIDAGGEFTISEPLIEIAAPLQGTGEWEASWENLPRSEVVDMAQFVLDAYVVSGGAPTGHVDAPDVRYTDTTSCLRGVTGSACNVLILATAAAD